MTGQRRHDEKIAPRIDICPREFDQNAKWRGKSIACRDRHSLTTDDDIWDVKGSACRLISIPQKVEPRTWLPTDLG